MQRPTSQSKRASLASSLSKKQSASASERTIQNQRISLGLSKTLSSLRLQKLALNPRLSPLEYLNDMERRSYFFTRLRQRLDSRPEPNPMLKKYLEQPENYLHKTANQITSTVVRLAGL